MPPLFFQRYLLRSRRCVGYNVRIIGCAHFIKLRSYISRQA
ncbi:hypothetical protein BN128_2508 [Cronobacter sakazakii 696]|nr:hypothetical protein BN129_2586 [Cronobacter sakazakii 701]CCK08475.1 hypothetical protein BN128_2508 [Cronobacter sakazakii 696]